SQLPTVVFDVPSLTTRRGRPNTRATTDSGAIRALLNPCRRGERAAAHIALPILDLLHLRATNECVALVEILGRRVLGARDEATKGRSRSGVARVSTEPREQRIFDTVADHPTTHDEVVDDPRVRGRLHDRGRHQTMVAEAVADAGRVDAPLGDARAN